MMNICEMYIIRFDSGVSFVAFVWRADERVFPRQPWTRPDYFFRMKTLTCIFSTHLNSSFRRVIKYWPCICVPSRLSWCFHWKTGVGPTLMPFHGLTPRTQPNYCGTIFVVTNCPLQGKVLHNLRLVLAQGPHALRTPCSDPRPGIIILSSCSIGWREVTWSAPNQISYRFQSCAFKH